MPSVHPMRRIFTPRADEFGGRESAVLRYLLGRRFWFDEGRRQLAIVVGL